MVGYLILTKHGREALDIVDTEKEAIAICENDDSLMYMEIYT